MRFYQFVVLMAAVLFTISNCASASENSKLVVADGSVRVLTSYTPIKRRLRAESTNDGEEEQRMFSFKFTPSKTKEFEALIEGKPIKEAFNKLDLGKMTIAKKGKVEANMVKDVVKSDQFKVWFRHASKLNKQNPETAMLEQLTHSFGEKEVAIMISMSKNMLSDTGRMFGKLEKAQFSKWKKDHGEPTKVLQSVFKLTEATVGASPLEQKIFKAYSTWYKAQTKVKNTK